MPINPYEGSSSVANAADARRRVWGPRALLALGLLLEFSAGSVLLLAFWVPFRLRGNLAGPLASLVLVAIAFAVLGLLAIAANVWLTRFLRRNNNDS